MSIPIEAESPDMSEETGVYETCVFCDISTIYWNVKSNRPVCAMCSTLNSEWDIPTAKYNY